MFSTRITKMFDIKYPIVQGGMLWVSRAELVAAVSNAGGLGILTALSFSDPEDFRAEIRKTRKLTDKPFGINVTLLPTLEKVSCENFFTVAIEEGVRIVETAGRSPQPYMDQLKKADVTVIHKCTTVRHGKSAEKMGVDVISIDGFECAGHPGEQDVGSLVLIPAAAETIKAPVLASGGIADGRGLVAALALGAEGINMGTRFLITKESPIHPAIKGWIIRAYESDTVLVLRTKKNSLRALKTPISEKVLRMEREGATIDDIAHLISGKAGKDLLESGELDRGILSVGQSIGLIKDIPSVGDLVERMVQDARAIVTRLG